MDLNDKALYFVAVKVFLRKGSELLITHDVFGSWDLPGGRIRSDEFAIPLEEVVARKIREELGGEIVYRLRGVTNTFFQVQRHEATADNQQVKIFAVSFEAEYLGGDLKLGDHHDECRWVDVTTFEPGMLFEGGWLDGLRGYLDKVNNQKGGGYAVGDSISRGE